MKSSRFIFILFIILSVISYSISNTDKCTGRWQIIDKSNIKITLDWQILPKINTLVTEFRTNNVRKGSWYGFGLSSSSDKPIVDYVYVLRWKENDTDIFWDIYNITESNVIILKENNSSLITFQRLFSSGLLTVQPIIDLISIKTQCLYFVYMRGYFKNNKPLIPDEIHFNRSLCLTCQRFELTTSMNIISTTHLMIINNSTTKTFNENNSTTKTFNENNSTIKTLNQNISTSTLLLNYRNEFNFFWFGRIINRLWLNDYFNLSSLSSQNLRLDLQNLFLFLINHNSSFSFICNQFELYLLQSGSILFASNITLISNLSEDQTINIIENLLKKINNFNDYNLKFDLLTHHIKRKNELLQIDMLFQNFSHKIDKDFLEQTEINSALHLLIGCIVGIGCLMILITSILCLYGYYKCRRRQFRLFTERQTLKFKHDLNSYTWLGQQPSVSCSSSPYLIQSTSI